MALYRKVILKPGVYTYDTPKGKRIQVVDKAYIKKAFKTASEMLKVGLNIPAPYAHRDKNGVIPSLVNEDQQTDAVTKEKKIWSSDINAGFWKKFELTDKNEFAGYVDVPGDVNDFNTPAGKLSKTIKEVSVYIEPSLEDGSGRKWELAPRHIALVTNPVESNQENFELVNTEPEYALAMALSMANEIGKIQSSDDSDDAPAKKPGSSTPGKSSPKGASDKEGGEFKGDEGEEGEEEEEYVQGGNLGEVLTLLRDKADIEMPQDTTLENFLDRLRAILTSYKCEEEEEELTEMPKQAEVKPSPMQMSNEPKAPESLEVIDPKVNKILAMFMEQVQTQWKAKIEALIQKGKIGRKYAEAKLVPAVEALSMSLEDLDADGNLSTKYPIVMAIEALEDTDGLLDLAGGSENPGVVPGEPQDLSGIKPASSEELAEVYKYMTRR